MCMVDDADPWDVVTTTKPRARKQHRCGECSRTIEPGEQYHRVEGIVDGRAQGYVMCAHCDVLGSWLVAICGGYLYENVIEDVREHLSEGIGGADLARAWAWARIRWGQPHVTGKWSNLPGLARGAGLVPIPARPEVPARPRWAA